MKDLFVELGIFLTGNFGLRPSPDWPHCVQDFVFDDDGLWASHPVFRLAIFLALVGIDDRIAHEIRVPLDDSRENPFIGEVFDALFGIERFEMKGNRSTMAGP